MSVSVSAAQVRILVAAIVLVTIYQSGVLSIGDGRAESRSATAAPAAGALVPASKQSDQPPARLHDSAQPDRHGHHIARRYDPPAREPSSAEPSSAETAKTRQPLLPSFATVQEEKTANPRGPNAVLAPAAPAPRSEAEASSGPSSQRREPGDALAIIATLADTYDDTRMSPMWAGSRPSRAPLAAARLVTLFAACSCVAIGVCGAVAYKSRRRAGRA